MNEERQERCETCRFWEKCGSIVYQGVEEGSCRRFPPVIIAKQIDAEEVDEESARNGADAVLGFDSGIWPMTRDRDWCGEWQPIAKQAPSPIKKEDITKIAMRFPLDFFVLPGGAIGARYACKRAGIETIGDLVAESKESLLSKGFRDSDVDEVDGFLKHGGLHLRQPNQEGTASSSASPPSAPPSEG